MSAKPTFSPLASRTVATRKYSSRGGRKITRLIIHHTAGGTNEGNVTYLATGARKVSSTYVLQTTGVLVGIVPEQYRPWTTGSLAADGPSVTVETVNSSGAPSWRVTDAQLETLAQLAADLSTRYGWGPLNRKNVMGHREFASTACPGPYLWPRLDAIIERANEIRAGASPSKPAPTPGLPSAGVSATKYRVTTNGARLRGRTGPGTHHRQTMTAANGHVLDIVETRNGWARSTGGHWYSMQYLTRQGTGTVAKSISQMATEVIDGRHGIGHANRRRSLGVSASVYEQVRAEVNRRVSGIARPGKSVSQMATEVIAGKHGNGHDRRRRSLGVDATTYALVRAEVNRKV